MLYFVTGTSPVALQLVAGGAAGHMCQPGSNSPAPTGTWAADNGCVIKGPTGVPIPNPRWSAQRWLGFLERHVDAAPRCLFAVLPDVVCDHTATLARSLPWVQRVRELGYRTGLALQNGAERDPDIPWDAVDVAFLAGDDPFKLHGPAHRLTVRAHDAGKWVHMGRVNSARRLRRAAVMGCQSADGTFLSVAPDKNLPRMLRWFDDLTDRPPLPSPVPVLAAAVTPYPGPDDTPVTPQSDT